MFNNLREDKGVKILPLGNAYRSCYKALMRNELIALLGDRIFSKKEKALDVEFFGESIRVPRGPSYLSLKTGAAIMPCFVLMNGDGRCLFEFQEPLYPYKSEGSVNEKDMLNLTRQYLKVMERYIIKYPEQWFTFQDIWRDKSGKEGRCL